ncbi:MAG: lipoyl synthase [Actinomycetia bacterium]|nr:lipoyl synthase [Actinomycetes bacterium]
MTAAEVAVPSPALHVRWLGRVAYQDGLALQRGLHGHSPDDHLLLLEHDPVYTFGRRGDLGHLHVAAEAVGAQVHHSDRGGDVTFHGPGQLVGYPIRTVPGRRGGGLVETAAYVSDLEQLLIDTLTRLGLPGTGRLDGFPGVWVDPDGVRPRKIAAIGVRLHRGRSLHGFGLNVSTDLAWFGHMDPCGITSHGVTTAAHEGVHASMAEVVDVIGDLAAERWDAGGGTTRADVVWRQQPSDLAPFSRGEGPGRVAGGQGEMPDGTTRPEPPAHQHGTSVRLRGRLAEAGVRAGIAIGDPKPEWMRTKLRLGTDYRRLERTLRDLDLVTVCEEAGCPNISECWSDGTATFMINGERCTRACGFCLVDTRKPDSLDPAEPQRVAAAVERMGLDFAVVTAVARDDLDDGGAGGFAATIEAIRNRTPQVQIEILVPDCKGDPAALDLMFSARPDVLNHNIETVARLQRAARPSASYSRSLAVLARAKEAGLTTKSGMVVGLGEEAAEIEATLVDLRGVGVDILTLGQYLRPTSNHLPVANWWTPEDFEEFARIGADLGIGHIESSPLTRSSYHARSAADQV